MCKTKQFLWNPNKLQINDNSIGREQKGPKNQIQLILGLPKAEQTRKARAQVVTLAGGRDLGEGIGGGEAEA